MKNYFKNFSPIRIAKGTNPQIILESSVKFFEKKARWFIFGILFILTGFCVYFWYFFIYQSHWSETRKEEYAKTKERGAIFDENRFNGVIEETKRRRSDYDREFEEREDIFRLKK